MRKTPNLPSPKPKLPSWKAELLKAELVKRAGLQSDVAAELLTGTFPEQRAFIEDTAKLKAALCTRRAAKSYSAGIMLFRTALKTPGASVLYLALTRASAKNILWKDVLKVLNRKHKLNARFNESDLTVTLPNGSVIYVLGADADESQREKLLGQKYGLVVIDEAASFTTDLEMLVSKTLRPAVADYRGQIVLVGTPGDNIKSFFFAVTQEDLNARKPGWSVHTWNTFQNPYMAKEWQEDIDSLVSVNPLVQETPWFKQMYLGQWEIDDNKLVYRFSEDRNLVAAVPSSRSQLTYVLGVDLGYNDDSAFVLCAYYPESPVLYMVKTFKAPGMDVTDVANQIKKFHAEVPVFVTVVDGANKQAIAELNNRHGLSLITADKTGKDDFIQIMNADFVLGNIKAVAESTQELVKEWRELIWYERPPTKFSPAKRVEHPSLPNHLADAALYAFRHCYSYLFKQLKGPAPRTGTSEWALAEARRMEEEAEATWQKNKEKQASGADLWEGVSGEDLW